MKVNHSNCGDKLCLVIIEITSSFSPGVESTENFPLGFWLAGSLGGVTSFSRVLVLVGTSAVNSRPPSTTCDCNTVTNDYRCQCTDPWPAISVVQHGRMHVELGSVFNILCTYYFHIILRLSIIPKMNRMFVVKSRYKIGSSPNGFLITFWLWIVIYATHGIHFLGETFFLLTL